MSSDPQVPTGGPAPQESSDPRQLLTSDPRYELAFQAGVRLITYQHSAIDNLRTRATSVLSAATIAVSVLAGLGLVGKGVTLPVWFYALILTVLALIGATATIVSWPYDWQVGLSPDTLIDGYIESDPPRSLIDIHRDCAIYLQRHYDSNERKLSRLLLAFRAQCVLLVVEVMMMFVALAITQRP